MPRNTSASPSEKNLGPNSQGTGLRARLEGRACLPSVWPLSPGFLPVESRHRVGIETDIVSELKRERVIIGNAREIREEDPGIGGYKLWVMLCALFGSGFMPGRDSFYTLLRRHHLMLPPRKVRHTTN